MPVSALAYTSDLDVEPIFVRADPNGLAFDRQTDALYVADARKGAVLRIAGERREVIASIPSGGVVTANRLGGLAVTPNGTVYAMRIGHERAGALFEVEPGGQPAALDLSPRFWRLGVTYDATEHSLYTTQYLKSLNGPFEGSIVRIDLASGASSTVIEGLLKPIGIAKLGSTLIVSDARDRTVWRIELHDDLATSRTRIYDGGDRPDSICAHDASSVLLTTYDESARRGAVHRVWLDGRVRTIGSGPWQPRGVASDGERVFVASRRAGRVLVFRA